MLVDQCWLDVVFIGRARPEREARLGACGVQTVANRNAKMEAEAVITEICIRMEVTSYLSAEI